jgi:hypothetical protein
MAKRKENPEAEVKALSAIEIATELRTITDSIIEAGGECSDDVFQQLENWQVLLEVKAENIGLVKERIEAEIEYFKRIEEAARARRKARENTIDRLRKYLAGAMQMAGVKSIKRNDGLFSISLVDGREAVEIDDQNKIPMDLCEIVEVVKPLKDKIQERIAAGQQVPGAHIERGEPYVMIR